MSFEAILGPAKRGYVSTARLAARAIDRLGGMPSSPPPLEDRRRNWLYSLRYIHDSMALAEMDVPWWTYDAIDAVQDWIDARPHPIRGFEYGSGASSFWLARRIDHLDTVENHRGFGELMAKKLVGVDNVSLHIVEPTASADPVVPSHKEHYAHRDFAAYVSAIDDFEGEFDLVVIDGRAREACLRAAIPRLKDDGLIIFDNTLRRRYVRAIREAPVAERRYRGLTPTLPYPDQTSLLTKR